MENIGNYYLDVERVIDLPSPKRNFIMELYRDMHHYFADPNRKEMANSYFNTLDMGGYLKNRLNIDRDKKLCEIVDE